MDLSLAGILLVGIVALILILKAAARVRPAREYGYSLRTPFLSAAERSFYGVLCTAVANRYVVLAKVRVADVITPQKSNNRSKWQTAFNRISAKHFDYVLCDPKTLSVEHVVELHDRSHKRANRAQRDKLLRTACESAGLSLIEFAAKPAYSVDEIRQELNRINAAASGDGRVEPHF